MKDKVHPVEICRLAASLFGYVLQLAHDSGRDKEENLPTRDITGKDSGLAE